ncbi:hypothetical protein Anapl_09060 [Anas platyrhynchos]|uniref:Uncharacterized protein n=1 Tax=Anas platyrhynchos TaxID=8839 RepID=R0LZM7_ANAPL|nr:hypothetical protein Anapl_09060 [Anas platyrhynchos]
MKVYIQVVVDAFKSMAFGVLSSEGIGRNSSYIMNASFICEENIQKAQLLLLGKLVTKTVVGNLSEEAVGITSKDVWHQAHKPTWAVSGGCSGAHFWWYLYFLTRTQYLMEHVPEEKGEYWQMEATDCCFVRGRGTVNVVRGLQKNVVVKVFKYSAPVLLSSSIVPYPASCPCHTLRVQCLKHNVPLFKVADSMRCSVFVSGALNPGVTSGVKGKVKEMVSGTREASKSSLFSLKEVITRGCVTGKEVTSSKLPAKPASPPPPAIKHVIALQILLKDAFLAFLSERGRGTGQEHLNMPGSKCGACRGWFLAVVGVLRALVCAREGGSTASLLFSYTPVSGCSVRATGRCLQHVAGRRKYLSCKLLSEHSFGTRELKAADVRLKNKFLFYEPI